MSAIFISYTRRDPEGDAWADRLSDWFREWGYGFFRDKDHRDGVNAGDDWRQTLYAELDDATAMVCLCSSRYDSSPWCVGEVAIAVEKGKTVIPIQLARSDEELKREPLPLLLQTKQAIQVAGALHPSPEQLAEVKRRLRDTLRQKLNWRDLQHWDRSLPPYPGLPAFKEHQAPVFFGRDKAMDAVVEQLEKLSLRPGALLLLLGGSGYGKSSLVQAGVVPRLKGTGAEGWTVLPPFTPGDKPFEELKEAVGAAGGAFDPADPLGSLQTLQRRTKKPVLLVIDQFEELLTAGPSEKESSATETSELGTSKTETVDQGELFQAFLLKLLRARKPGLLVLATMRTDFLAPLQSRWPALTAMARPITLEPIAPEDFGVLITGPAKRASLSLEDGLETRLVKESGGRDALPLLAFVLEKLWKARTDQCLTLKAYEELEGVGGAVGKRAKECWDPETSSEEVRQALREAFLDHLVSVAGDGVEAKRPAPLAALPLASREIVQRMVDDRLLVLNDGIVEIAHEALLRTWEPLVRWLGESQEERLQCLRVKRLTADLVAKAPQRQRRQALEQLAGLAAAGGIERKAVVKEGQEPLAKLLASPAAEEEDRLDAVLVLALIGSEQPLRDGLGDTKAPVALRRRAAESLGLLAKRSGDRDQRHRIAAELEGWLRSEALDVGIAVELDPAVVAEVSKAVDAHICQLAAAGRLEGMSEELIASSRQDLVERELRRLPCDSGMSLGWKEHDERLPLLQGASRGLQLAASADLPLLGSDRETRVPMLTLTALQEGDGLRIRTEVVTPAVWRLPLPEGEQLELVVVEVVAGQADIGSPETEEGRDWYATQREGCKDPQTNRPLNVEAQRTVRLEPYGMVRHLITQAQWQAVAALPPVEGELNSTPWSFRPEAEALWERHGQPLSLPVDGVSWNDCQEWLGRLNRWLRREWPGLAGGGEAPQLALPSEGQWEAACRAGARTPFHFGEVLDASWANFDGGYTYGPGRKGPYRQRPLPVGALGLVNRWGLAEMHGQLFEWCGDQWHRDPLGEGWPADGQAWEGPDEGLEGSAQQALRLLRGGSWFFEPHVCRAAIRNSNHPAFVNTSNGVRPCYLLPPGSLLGT